MRLLFVSFLVLQLLLGVSYAEGISLKKLAALPEEELGKIDVALLNLICAEGLTGAENINLDKAHQLLGIMAAHIQSETQRHLYHYQKSPEKFKNMEGYFRMQLLVTVVQQDFKMRYNPDRDIVPGEEPESDDEFFADSKDCFVHGFFEREMGTCSSFPVLYTALARRLGYPVSLVTTAGHVFCRWESEDGSQTFNIEGTNKGMSSHPDSYYKKWPTKLTEEQIKANALLRPLTHKEELALFLSTRAVCARVNGQSEIALEAYDLACQVAPHIERLKLLEEKYNSRSE